jgi:alkylation response protein AidB-like acyl-CoA dehydrogenase
MDLAFTQSQAAERTALRALLEEHCPPERARALENGERGFCEDLWERMRKEGWLAAGPLVDLSLRFQELGRAGVPGPFLAHFESLLLLRECGAKLPGGAAHVSLALLEASGSMDLADLAVSCSRDGDGYRLSGAKLFVPWADLASELLVVARCELGGGLSLFAFDGGAPGVDCTALSSLGPERLFALRLSDVRLGRDALLAEDAEPRIELARARATLLVCAELVGAAEASLERAVAHARNREQFGQPIGAFQAVAHHCANMAMDVDAARLAVQDAAARIDAGESPVEHAARAKVVCSEAARRVTTTAHQVMGGVGFLVDADLERYTRCVKALESRLGTPDWHRECLADALGLQA